MAVTRQQVEAMIRQYTKEIGLTEEQTYLADKNKWHWNYGSAHIEVFIEDVPVGNDQIRQYLRIFSALMEVPKENELGFYRHLLELNDIKLGVKLSVMANSPWVFATYERDINGIDYEEVKTCIADLEWWADTLDDQLKAKFAGAGSRPDRVM